MSPATHTPTGFGSFRCVRPENKSEMKPLQGTRTLAGPQGSASKLGATLGFGLQPLRGKAESAQGLLNGSVRRVRKPETWGYASFLGSSPS